MRFAATATRLSAEVARDTPRPRVIQFLGRLSSVWSTSVFRKTVIYLLSAAAILMLVLRASTFKVPLVGNWAVSNQAWLEVAFADGLASVIITLERYPRAETWRLYEADILAGIQTLNRAEGDGKWEYNEAYVRDYFDQRMPTYGSGWNRAASPIHRFPWCKFSNSPTHTTDSGQVLVRRIRIDFPLMLLFLALAICPAIAVIRGPLRRSHRQKQGQCLSCGYDLTGNVSGACPECGRRLRALTDRT